MIVNFKNIVVQFRSSCSYIGSTAVPYILRAKYAHCAKIEYSILFLVHQTIDLIRNTFFIFHIFAPISAQTLCGPILANFPYILTVQDDLSEFLIAVPMRGQTAEEASNAFVENVILVYGLPQVVLSDCGANFLSDTFMRICKLLCIKKIKTTQFRPESNGSNERSYRSLSILGAL
jgi:transposase InsO family protein